MKIYVAAALLVLVLAGGAVVYARGGSTIDYHTVTLTTRGDALPHVDVISGDFHGLYEAHNVRLPQEALKDADERLVDVRMSPEDYAAFTQTTSPLHIVRFVP